MSPFVRTEILDAIRRCPGIYEKAIAESIYPNGGTMLGIANVWNRARVRWALGVLTAERVIFAKMTFSFPGPPRKRFWLTERGASELMKRRVR